jgi:hypothetical protein
MAATGDLARYRYIQKIGSGGMATVDLAEDTLLGREVALKRLAGAADAQGISRLRREALLGASVSHPNLVSIYDIVATEDGHLVIVMEYIRGETLRNALSRQGRLAPEEALRILDGVAAGLDAIHDRRIVHRDVKPSNILLGAGGLVKVADLGIASVPDQTRITTSGSLLGSLSYMAPEQLGDAVATQAIDIYALAAMAYEMLGGQKARREANPVALAHAINTQPPPDLRSVWPQAPASVAGLLLRGMAREPQERPRSATELVARLHAGLGVERTTVSSAAATPPSPALAGAAPAPTPVAPPPAAAAAAAAAAGAGEEAAARPTREHPATEQTDSLRRPMRIAPAAAAGAAAAAAGVALADAQPAGPRSAAPAADPRARARAPESRRTTPAPGDGSRASRGAGGHGGPGGRAGGSMLSEEPRRSNGRLIAAGLLALVALIAVLAVALSGGSPPAHQAAGTAAASRAAGKRRSSGAHRGKSTAAAPASSSSSATSAVSSSTPAVASSSASGTTAAAPAPTGAAASPSSAVESFYGSAASHNYAYAWALADPALRGQLGGYSAFESQQAGDRSITFQTAKTVSQSATTATVDIGTTSVRNDGTHHCTGAVGLVLSSSHTWLLDRLENIYCT